MNSVCGGRANTLRVREGGVATCGRGASECMWGGAAGGVTWWVVRRISLSTPPTLARVLRVRSPTHTQVRHLHGRDEAGGARRAGLQRAQGRQGVGGRLAWQCSRRQSGRGGGTCRREERSGGGAAAGTEEEARWRTARAQGRQGGGGRWAQRRPRLRGQRARTRRPSTLWRRGAERRGAAAAPLPQRTRRRACARGRRGGQGWRCGCCCGRGGVRTEGGAAAELARACARARAARSRAQGVGALLLARAGAVPVRASW